MADRDTAPENALETVLDALNRAFASKYYSLAQYTLTARPYVRPGTEAGLRVLEDMAASDRLLADELAQAIEQLEGIPQLATFDPEVASFNYLALDHLLKVLSGMLARQLTQYEAGLAVSAGFPQAHALFERLCATTREQLKALDALQQASL